MSPSYQANDPKGWCGDPRRGAAMGRPTVKDLDPATPVKLYLRREYLSGDYDRNGTYFGQGSPLYWCANADGAVDFMLRALSRAEAKAIVLKSYPKASFYR